MGQNTYVAVGNKEDVSNIITNIAPYETPLYSAWEDVGATATYHEWLEDTLRAPQVNTRVEGYDYNTVAPDPRQRFGNYTQIMDKGYNVTKTQEKVAKYGVNSEIAYQMRKALKELALDIELAILTSATRNAGTASVARVFGGIPYWVTTHVVAAGGAALTETIFNDTLQAIWQDGGNPADAYVDGGQKRVMSSWSGDGQRYLQQNEQKIRQRINVYESDFGTIALHAHRLMPAETVYILDMPYWKMATLRPIHQEPLPNISDNERKLFVGELTIEARAEKANGIINGLAAAPTGIAAPDPGP